MRPQEESREAIWNSPNQRVSVAIFEVTWRKSIARKTFALSSTGYFSRHEDREYEVATRARMPVTRVCVHHVDNVAAGKLHTHGILHL